MAVAIPSNMASRGPTGNHCMVQNPFTKWQYSSPDIIHLLIGQPPWELIKVQVPCYQAVNATQ